MKESAEQRFRRAFERLKADEPEVVPKGTPVSENNVALEAGCKEGAVKKARFPLLVEDIQAFVKKRDGDVPSQHQKLKARRAANRDKDTQIADLTRQRDVAQSQLASANRRIVELTGELNKLRGSSAGPGEIRPFRG